MLPDTSNFIVRLPYYRQDPNYLTYCGLALQRLESEAPATMRDFLTIAMQEVQKFYYAYDTSKIDQLGLIAPHVTLRDDVQDSMLNGLFSSFPEYAATALERYPNTLGKITERPRQERKFQFTYDIHSLQAGTTRQIPLSQIVRVGSDDPIFPGIMMTRHMKPDFKRGHFRTLWKELEQHYAKALDDRLPHEAREDAAIDAYYLLSHLMPPVRGCASCALLLRQYLAGKCGMELPYMREGVDINLEALLSFRDDFKANYKSGIFFDRDVTRDEMLAWQRERSGKGDPRLQTDVAEFIQIVHQFHTAGTRQYHTMYNNVLHQLLFSTPPHITPGHLADGEPCLHFTSPHSHFHVHPVGYDLMPWLDNRALFYKHFPDGSSKTDDDHAEDILKLASGEMVLTASGLRPVTEMVQATPAPTVGNTIKANRAASR